LNFIDIKRYLNRYGEKVNLKGINQNKGKIHSSYFQRKRQKSRQTVTQENLKAAGC